MEQDRWNRIQEILGAAIEADPADRPDLLARECGDDADLRLEVESLLAASDEADDYFGGLADRAGVGEMGGLESAPTAETIDEDGTLDLTGRRVGAYRLVRLIGRGGMGTVYLAERDDGQFEHRVALKLLPLGTAASRDAHSRFLAERGILARLEHPNIARLLDGGVLEDGTPYFAMEFVDGTRIDDYCDEHQLTIDQRLQLFLRVCDAVSHAHHSLVVHRDLKPANVLVANDEVKLLDFGIAKLIDPEQSLGLTAAASGMAPMTPAYACPEQLRGEPITTATDVYALGVLLHELLAGVSPYQLGDNNPGAMLLAICEQTVTDPSSRIRKLYEGATATSVDSAAEAISVERIAQARGTSPAALSRKLKGDLDTIILKTLRKEPSRRYESVGRLADDVRRHLDGYPVEARKESFGYRASRFLKRHKVAAGLGAAATIFLAAFIGTAAWFAINNAAQSRRIAQEQVRADETLELMTQLYQTADPAAAPGETVTAREVLDAAVERLSDEQSDPATRAQLMLAAGRVYRRLNYAERSRPLLTEALAIRRELYESPHEAIGEAALELGSHLYRSGEIDAGIELLEESLEIFGETTGPDTLDAALAHYELGTALHDAGQLGPSSREFDAAVQIYLQQPPAHTIEHADVLTQLANYITVTGDVDDSRQMLEQALEINLDLRGENHPVVAQNLSWLGTMYWNRGDKELGIETVRRAAAINQNVYGDSEGHVNVAVTLQNLGTLLASDGDPEGFTTLREAADMFIDLNIEPMSVGYCLTLLANAYRNADRPAEADDTYREALQVYDEGSVEGLPVANTQLNFARLLVAQEDDAEAVTMLEAALASYSAVLPDDHPRILQINEQLDTLRAPR